MTSKKLPPSTKPLAVVTGAGSGIGLAFANHLAEEGYDLLLVESDPECLSACHDQLQRSFSGISVITIEGDITSKATWEEVIKALEDRPVSLLVNNAGTLLAGDLTASTPDDLKRVIDVNLTGTIFACHALIPRLSVTPRSPYPSGVINVASIFAVLSPPGFTVYNASKAGVVALSETLRGELKPDGHTVTVILPGLVPTGLFERGRYPSDDFREQVLEYATGAELTPESVVEQALEAFRRGKLEVAIGKRARRYWRLKRWIPTTVLDVVANKTRQALGK